MLAFRIQNYRSVHDSGWLEINSLLAVVGKNESGKTSLLKALWKFNPHQDETFDVRKDWPRGKKSNNKEDEIVVSVKFSVDQKEKSILARTYGEFSKVNEVIVSRNFKGDYFFEYDFILKKREVNSNQIQHAFYRLQKNSFPSLEKAEESTLQQLVSSEFKKRVEDRKRSKSAYFNPNEIGQLLQELLIEIHTVIVDPLGSKYPFSKHYEREELEEIFRKVENFILEHVKEKLIEIIKNPISLLDDFIRDELPELIYMDEYKVFKGSVNIKRLLEREKEQKLTDEEKTFLLLSEMSGLELKNLVADLSEEDRQQRMLDLNEASQEVTKKIAGRWTQKNYEIIIQADGDFLMIFVKDDGTSYYMPLEERSKGFQWFFSFDMHLSYETAKNSSPKILLLDEPGLHLHAAAQKDLLSRLNEFSSKNQIIYTTHLPFMVDCLQLDNVCIAEEEHLQGSSFKRNYSFADLDSKSTLQAALGINWSQSLLFGKFNLIVEGVTDLWYLTSLSIIFEHANRLGLDEELTITPAGGGTKAAYLATILCGQELKCMLLVDSDEEGDKAYSQLVHHWIMKDRFVFKLGDIADISHECSIEDLFDPEYYLEKVNLAYERELSGNKLIYDKEAAIPTVEMVKKQLGEFGVSNFNKGRVCKKILMDLQTKSYESLSEVTKANFEKVFSCLNKVVVDWREET